MSHVITFFCCFSNICENYLTCRSNCDSVNYNDRRSIKRSRILRSENRKSGCGQRRDSRQQQMATGKKAGDSLISSDVIRGYNDLIILYLLTEHESYGYEISRQIREISEEKYIIKETTLYSAFSRLEKNQYIESFYGSETNGKRRTYYRITPKGREAYKEKCQEWFLVKDVVGRFVSDEGPKSE